ncbi:hypothetical protein [Herbaspirillum sp. RV1423]|uniref:hypothetical protein n=1 Tax=Herbaspirillum sp. RV1423 TaxID=1443993 RepID=UPI0012DE78F0|nr:hypothetical protein [Herbaspirillum sp. RV1423]
MTEDNENEVVVGSVIYTFASAAVANPSKAYLDTRTIASCKLDYPPRDIYPPLFISPTQLPNSF